MAHIPWIDMRAALDEAEAAIAKAARLAAQRGDGGALDETRRLRRQLQRIERTAFAGAQVYVLRRAGARLVKIGVTRSLARRVAALRTGAGAELEVLCAFPGERADEQRIHQRFASARRDREWFTYTPALERWVTSVQRGASPHA